jgi:hypothetical protein
MQSTLGAALSPTLRICEAHRTVVRLAVQGPGVTMIILVPIVISGAVELTTLTARSFSALRLTWPLR